MKGWSELLQHLRAEGLTLEEVNERQVELTLSSALTHRVRVSLLDVSGVDWCELTAIVGERSSILPDRALFTNATVLGAALCLHGQHYRLRCTHALAHTTGPGFLFYLRKFAAEAVDLQQEAATPMPDSTER